MREQTLRERLIEFGYAVEGPLPGEVTAEAAEAIAAEWGRFEEALRRIAAARASGSEPEPPSSPLIAREWEFLGHVRDGMRIREIDKLGLGVVATLVMHKLGMREWDEVLAWLQAHDPAAEAAALLGVSVERIEAYWATPVCDRPEHRCRQGLPATRRGF